MHPSIQAIQTEHAPKTIGPYSQALCLPPGKPLLFVSGQIPIDPKTGSLLKQDIRAQTKQVLQNLSAILFTASSSLEFVLRTDIFLRDLSDFSAVNEEYEKFFKGPLYPARQTVEVSQLPLGALIEVSCIATKNQ